MNEFKKLFNDVPTPIVKFKIKKENEPIIISANESFVDKFTKNENQELSGMKLNDLIVPENKKEQSKKFDKRTYNGDMNIDIVERVTPEGIRRFAYRSVSYNNNKGFAMYTDISEDIQRSEHIKVLNRILRHNLRNELNVITGLNNIIKEETRNKDIESYCEKIDICTSGLTQLTEEARVIDEIINNTRELSVLNLETQVKFALDECARNLDTSCVNTDIDSDICVKVGDKLHSVLESVIDNAIRYNNADQPKVKLYTNNINKKWVEICIQDNGPGIPKSERNIINRDKEISELNHGSGLGLWLTKWIIEKYRGKVQIETNKLGGSTVKIKLLRHNL